MYRPKSLSFNPKFKFSNEILHGQTGEHRKMKLKDQKILGKYMASIKQGGDY